MIPLHITLAGQPGALTGTITIADRTWRIAQWRMGGDPGHVNARADDGTQITLAIAQGHGGLTIGGETWALEGVRWEGMVLSAEARVVDWAAVCAEVLGV